MTSYVTIARIVKTRGVRGEVAADLFTDFPERFAVTRKVRVLRGKVQFWEEIEQHWFHKGRVILKFRRGDRPDDVTHLIGGEVQIPEEQRVPLPESTFYHSDLIGCQVVEDGKRMGQVVEIFATGSEGANLVVRTDTPAEVMIPLVDRFVCRVDLVKKTIEVSLPPGLLELGVIERRQKKEKRETADK
ncbi:MAG: ribosome maturation factor RimM [Acidobacteriota bacterium]